jgi:SNF2 family DNA or RNA helicase
MKDNNDDVVYADASVTKNFSAIAVTPKEIRSRLKLGKFLGTVVPRNSISLTATGYLIDGFAASSLLNTQALGLHLTWSDDAERFVKNRGYALSVHESVKQQLSEIIQGGLVEAKKYIDNEQYFSVLDNHQVINVAAMTLQDSYGMCVFDEQGAGKTVSMIYAFDTLVEMDVVDVALIVAPKSMVSEWPKDFKRFTGNLYKITEITGKRLEKKSLLTQGADIYITNFETCVALEAELRSVLRRYNGRAILVVDESFFVKNLDAQRTKAIRRLREWCDRAYILCGTPAPNSPEDLVQQFNIVDYGITFNNLEIPKDRDSAQHIVQEAIESKGVFVRHLKSDVLPSLPSKSFNRVLVKMEPTQLKLYKSVLDGYIGDLRATSADQFRRNITSFLAKRMNLLQICSNPKTIEAGYAETPAKLKALDPILEETILKRGEKVVLWSFFTKSLDEIYRRYSRFNPVRYDGTITDAKARKNAIINFQEDDKTMLFVANPAAAGAGITLHRARVAIYESMSNQAAHFLQSLDRIHRRGQTRDVQYLVLLCDASLEIFEYDRLLEKEKSAQNLLRDHISAPITRDILLDEANKAVALMRSVL